MSNAAEQPLEIICYPDPFLTKSARPVTAEEIKAGKADNWDLAELVQRMRATMYAAEGVGLAAPQVKVGLRLFVADVTKDHSGFFAIINPVLTDPLGSKIEEEGCLSIPAVRAKVKRAAAVTVSGFDPQGHPISFEATEMLARVCLHEHDHLEGVLFVNKLGMTAKLMIRRQLIELEEDYQDLHAKRKVATGR